VSLSRDTHLPAQAVSEEQLSVSVIRRVPTAEAASRKRASSSTEPPVEGKVVTVVGNSVHRRVYE
jgi:hypothetical protein